MIYDPTKGYWKEVGTIITNRNNVSLKGDEIHFLGASLTKIRIEEREREVSYLDSIRVIYTDGITNLDVEKSFDVASLKNNDESYYTLRHGQSLTLDLKGIVPENARSIRLKVNGYYEVSPWLTDASSKTGG